MTVLTSTRPTEGRDAIVSTVITGLLRRFPLLPASRVEQVVIDSYDSIVGRGVPLHDFLPNIVEHRARTRLLVPPTT
ncbi:three-helix bundle dimerization domain-containing protein [Frigoribacterium sp. MCBA15_019]|uniref:three-helix bundle dimerization domain-containing protein n=1 Tax=unclassified Frigoribacterium TaxID=2627005 RepID=UPI0008DE1285|nr:hypothetical protein [Frigoribacterium sp. MCBA15_019]OII26066.1 hypothetical protein BIV04_14200 [Frigoribacterium sp. MCBA15_019]